MRNICDIAQDIIKDWKKVHFAAAPYLHAMTTLNTTSDRYGHDDAKGIILYFLSNASSYQGDTARQLKAELKSLIK